MLRELGLGHRHPLPIGEPAPETAEDVPDDPRPQQGVGGRAGRQPFREARPQRDEGPGRGEGGPEDGRRGAPLPLRDQGVRHREEFHGAAGQRHGGDGGQGHQLPVGQSQGDRHLRQVRVSLSSGGFC